MTALFLLLGPVAVGLCWVSVLYFGFAEKGPAGIELIMFALGVGIAVTWVVVLTLWLADVIDAPWPLHWQTNIIDPRRVT